MFERTLDLYLDLTRGSGQANPLLAAKTSTTTLARLSLIQGDKVPVRLWCLTPATTIGAAPAVTALDAGAAIVLGARKASAPTTGDLLFSITDFAETGAGDDLHYAGTLDLNTVALNTALGNSAGLAVLVDIEIQNADNTQRITYQFEATVKAHVVRGTEGIPATGNPPYPAPDQLVVKQGNEAWYRFGTDGHLYLYHQATGLWHTVQLQLVESTLTLTVNQSGAANVP